MDLFTVMYLIAFLAVGWFTFLPHTALTLINWTAALFDLTADLFDLIIEGMHASLNFVLVKMGR